MKWTTSIHLSPAAYFIMMAGAAVICLYNAVIQLVLTGFSYHVLIQILLALNAVYMLYRKRMSGREGFDIEIFFIIMAGIVVLAFSAGSWILVLFSGNGLQAAPGICGAHCPGLYVCRCAGLAAAGEPCEIKAGHPPK